MRIRIPTDGERFKERLFVALCDLVDVRGKRYWWLVAVDQQTDYTVIVPCPSHKGQAVAKKIFEHWIRWGGPMSWCAMVSAAWELVKFSRTKLSVSGTQVQTTAPYSAWQKKVELRRGYHHQRGGGQDDRTTPGGGEEWHVICQLRGGPCTEPRGGRRAGRWGIPPATRVFGQRMKVCGRTSWNTGRSCPIQRWGTREMS